MFLLIGNNSLIQSFAGAFWWTKQAPQYTISRSSKDTTLSTHKTGLGSMAQPEWHTQGCFKQKNHQFSSKVDVTTIRTPVFIFHFPVFFFSEYSCIVSFSVYFVSELRENTGTCMLQGTGEKQRTTFRFLPTFALLWQGPACCFCCCGFHLLG